MSPSGAPDTFTDVGDPVYLKLFDDLGHSLFRLETLQSYAVEYERREFEEFLRTGRLDRPAGDWQRMISRHTAAGRPLQRVHIVREPLTDYLRYELGWSYPPNVDVGEDIRILPTQPGRWPALPRHDYWLFDSSDLWVMEYAEDGAFRWIEQVDAPAVIVRHAYWRDAALHQAIPYRDYMRRAQLLAAS